MFITASLSVFYRACAVPVPKEPRPRDLVGVLAGHGVAAALDRQPDDVIGVEVVGFGSEGSGAGVLDALVNRQDGDVAGAGVPAGGAGKKESEPESFPSEEAVTPFQLPCWRHLSPEVYRELVAAGYPHILATAGSQNC